MEKVTNDKSRLEDCREEIKQIHSAVKRLNRSWASASRLLFVIGGVTGLCGGYLLGKRAGRREVS